MTDLPASLVSGFPCRLVYEAIDPAWIGHAEGTRIVLGKLSGRAGLCSRARQLGYDLDTAQLGHAYALFQALAETQAEVRDAELSGICEAALARAV